MVSNLVSNQPTPDDILFCLKSEAIQYSGAYASMGVDNSLRFNNFCNKLRVEIIQLTDDEMEFDMIGIDASLANAFRRILIAEACFYIPAELHRPCLMQFTLAPSWSRYWYSLQIPTMAFEKILMVNNTSVIADDVLSHRIGLIPLDVDPRLFEYLSGIDVCSSHGSQTLFLCTRSY